MTMLRLSSPLTRLILGACALLAFAPAAAGQDVKVDHTARYIGSGRYSWTIFIKAAESTLGRIEYVEYTLHPTYRPPKQKVISLGKKKYPFAFSSAGSGEFNIRVEVKYKGGQKSDFFDYKLKLYENKTS